MKTYDFDFFSNHFNSDEYCHLIDVTVSVVITGGESVIDEIEIYDKSAELYRDISDFPEKERREIEDKVKDILEGNHEE